ncbi:MAG: trimethylamine methyltransferase family protein [Alphaproteobacteria bacterium]|nr:trimethylamine methyltransferase family protein [Alphaproteobacteria bacterium]
MARERRRERRTRGASIGVRQSPWREVVNRFPPMTPVSQDELEFIQGRSLKVLEEIGIEFLHDRALDILAAGGADVNRDTKRVHFDRGLVTEAVGKAPAEYPLHARNPERTIMIGGNRIAFCPVASPPFAHDMDGGRREGNFKDYCNFLRLAQSLNALHFFGGYPVEPTDLPAATRHLDCLSAFVTLTDRAWHAYSLGAERIDDALSIICIARGKTRDEIRSEPSIVTVINANSPLRYDTPMLDGLMAMAEHGQPVIITPFTLSGAMAPSTIAGALTQQNAEALAGLTMVQLTNPGAPVAYGGFTSNVDMKTGAPAFGTPEYTRAAMIGGQLARLNGVPYRSSNVNASTSVDAQAAYESQMSLWGAVMGHANIVLHGAGWLEGGLVASFEKMVIDADTIQMITEVMQPIEVTDKAIGIEAMRDVGPGGHFFGTQHTLDRYDTAFYEPMVSDWRNFESWEEAGGSDAATRANALYKQLLSDYEAPALDPAIAEELEGFVTRRKTEMNP